MAFLLGFFLPLIAVLLGIIAYHTPEMLKALRDLSNNLRLQRLSSIQLDIGDGIWKEIQKRAEQEGWLKRLTLEQSRRAFTPPDSITYTITASCPRSPHIALKIDLARDTENAELRVNGALKGSFPLEDAPRAAAAFMSVVSRHI